MSSSSYSRVAVNTAAALYYKEFQTRSPWQSCRALVSGGRARRTQRNCAALLQAGFEAPIEVGTGSLPGGGEYRFTRALSGTPLNHWLLDAELTPAPEPRPHRHQLLAALGTFVGRLHNTGFIAGELEAGNILVAMPGERPGFALIDNEGNRHCSPAPGKQLLHNLVQLNRSLPSQLSRCDRYRVLQAWHRQMPELSPLEARILARAICQHAPAHRAAPPAVTDAP